MDCATTVAVSDYLDGLHKFMNGTDANIKSLAFISRSGGDKAVMVGHNQLICID
jgi:hypothetical protein